MNVRPALSVVILAYHDAPTVVDAVASVLAQEASEPIETILVTSGGDEAAAIARERFPGVHVIESPTRLLPGAARNAGAAVARGDVIAFLAADCVAEPGWAAARLAAHRDGHPVVASAVTIAGRRTPSAWGSHLSLFGGRSPHRPAEVVMAPDPAAHGLSFDRAALVAAGPFPEDVRIGEDTVIGARLSAAGVAVWYEPAVRAGHPAPARLRPMLASHFGRGIRSARTRPPAEYEGQSQARRLRRSTSAILRHPYRVLRTLLVRTRGNRIRSVAYSPWIVAACVAYRIGWVRTAFRAHAARHRERVTRGERRRPSTAIAAGLALLAAIAYGATVQPSWTFDPLRYAALTERGPVRDLLNPQHALANAVPLVAFRALRASVSGVRALPVQAAVAIAGAGAAVGLTFLTGRRLGGTRAGALTGALALAGALGTWRAGSAAGVYGLTLAVLCLTWLIVARFLDRPTVTGAAWTGAATGAAIATHLGAATILPAAVLAVWTAWPRGGRAARARAVAAFAGAVVAVAGTLVLAVGLAARRGSLRDALAFAVPSIGGTADPVLAGGATLVGLGRNIAAPATGSLRLWVAIAVTLLAVIVLVRGLALAGVGGRPRITARALLVNAVLAAGAAAFVQGTRRDYFTLALPSLALLWSAGGPLMLPRTIARSRPVVAAGVVVGLALAGWNLGAEVLPGLDRSRIDARAVASIADGTPEGPLLLLSPVLAPGADYERPPARTGWAVLLGAVQDGADPPGLIAALQDADREVVVSDRAFRLTSRQEAFLDTTEEALWSTLLECCAPREILRVETSAGPETLYALALP